MANGKTRWKILWRRLARPALLFASLLTLLRSSLADWNYVVSDSMNPTILQGDCILVNKLAYDLKVPFTTTCLAEWAAPERGDIVLFLAPDDGNTLVKRVVGVPYDQIELRNNRLLVNGEPAEYEPTEHPIGLTAGSPESSEHCFIQEKIGAKVHLVMLAADQPANRSIGPLTVPAGQFFVLEDNRDESVDSRSFGFVGRDRIMGRATSAALNLRPDHSRSLAGQRLFRKLP